MADRRFPILLFVPDDPSLCVLQSGLVHRLCAEIPNAAFTLVGDAGPAAIYADLPALEAVLPRPEGLKAQFSLWRSLRRRRWGLILDPVGSPLAPWLPAARRALRRKRPGPADHAVVEAARLLKLEDEPPAPFIFTGEETQARAAELTGDGPILAMAPGAGWLGRIWPSERFALTALRLLGADGPLAGGRLLLVGEAEDWRAAEGVRRSFPRERWADLTGQPAVVCAAALARARLFIGGDNAFTHMAAAARVPGLALFGPSDEARRGPWGEAVQVLRGPRSYEQFLALDPELNQSVHHMMDLPAEAVIDAAERRLAESA